MKKSSYPGAAIAFAVSTIAIGVSYWQVPYSQLALPNALFGIGMLITFVAGIVIRATGTAAFHETLLMTGSVFVAVVLARIVVDVIADPGTHNLWPFELLISSIVGLLVGLAAAGTGSLLNSLRASKGAE